MSNIQRHRIHTISPKGRKSVCSEEVLNQSKIETQQEKPQILHLWVWGQWAQMTPPIQHCCLQLTSHSWVGSAPCLQQSLADILWLWLLQHLEDASLMLPLHVGSYPEGTPPFIPLQIRPLLSLLIAFSTLGATLNVLISFFSSSCTLDVSFLPHFLFLLLAYIIVITKNPVTDRVSVRLY